jgi:hypothetical protein
MRVLRCCSRLPVYTLLCVALVAYCGLWGPATRSGYLGPLCCFNIPLQSCNKFLWEMLCSGHQSWVILRGLEMRRSHLQVHTLLCVALVAYWGLRARGNRPGYSGPLWCCNISEEWISGVTDVAVRGWALNDRISTLTSRWWCSVERRDRDKSNSCKMMCPIILSNAGCALYRVGN